MKRNVKFRWAGLVAIAPPPPSRLQALQCLVLLLVIGVVTSCFTWLPSRSAAAAAVVHLAGSSKPLVHHRVPGSIRSYVKPLEGSVVGHSQFQENLKASLGHVPDKLKVVVSAIPSEVRKERKPVRNVGKKDPSTRIEQLPGSWNTEGFRFSPRYKDWDHQRSSNSTNQSGNSNGKTRNVMLVSGDSWASSPRTVIDILNMKNKLDFAAIQNFQFYLNLGVPHPLFVEGWKKVSVLRMLMVNHPHVNWFVWVDSDTWFTNLTFHIPWEKYSGKNLVVTGDDKLTSDGEGWKRIRTSFIGIRNCQWSLDLLDAWASFGTKRILKESGRFLSKAFRGRPEGLEADDASALAYLLTHGGQKWSSRVVFAGTFSPNLHWSTISPQFEKITKNSGSGPWPLWIHFDGCRESSRLHTNKSINGTTSWDTCRREMLRTFDFADQQVLRRIGFRKLEPLGSANPAAIPMHIQQPKREEGEPYHIVPNVSDWDDQRAARRDRPQGLWTHKPSTSTPNVVLVSGSGARDCADPRGTEFLTKALKNKADYARMHGMRFFYNTADLDGELRGWWMKSPIIRAVMLAHPEVEWVWWIDSDAVITDMVFEPPWAKYEDVNLVVWGEEDKAYRNRSFLGINAGIMILRNCQWSLDLLDSIIPMGPFGAVREGYGRMLSEFLTDRPAVMQADDQSAILYMLLTQREKYASKTFLESEYILSGSWHGLTKEFEGRMEQYRPGVGDWRWPLITHFAGCGPCSAPHLSNFRFDVCLQEMDRALHFADNQVVQPYGLRHETLNSSRYRTLKPVEAF